MNYTRIFLIVLCLGVLAGVGIGFYNYFHYKMWETLSVGKQIFSIGFSLILLGFAGWLTKRVW